MLKIKKNVEKLENRLFWDAFNIIYLIGTEEGQPNLFKLKIVQPTLEHFRLLSMIGFIFCNIFLIY